MKKKNTGVSPIIGVLLLLGLTVGFVALTSNILFGLFDSPASPASEIEITHETNGGSSTADILIVRNENIDEFSYIVGDQTCFIDTGTAVESGDSFIVPDDGEQSDGTSCSSSVSLESGDSVIIRGRVGSDVFVIDNYVIPNL